MPNGDSTAITCLSDKSRPEQGYVTIRNEIGRYVRYEQGAGGIL